MQRTTRVMGVINVTPDSFSGDGLYGRLNEVEDRARKFERDGAAIIDVGGESTRPGYRPVSLAEELRRVIPAIRAIAGAVSLPISVDTAKPDVARQALAEGASIVNDVSGGSEHMAREVAAAGASLVLVHPSQVPLGRDIVAAITRYLRLRIEIVEAAGIRSDRILVDPGLGFGKEWRENFAIIRRLDELHALGKPILVGPSRKGMISRVLRDEAGNRWEGTLALVSLCVANGADVVRVHDVQAMKRAVVLTDAILAVGGERRR